MKKAALRESSCLSLCRCEKNDSPFNDLLNTGLKIYVRSLRPRLGKAIFPPRAEKENNRKYVPQRVI